ncbi:MAG: hypothetical protein ACREQT_06020 [Candidatus Binataceae bacterium]
MAAGDRTGLLRRRGWRGAPPCLWAAGSVADDPIAWPESWDAERREVSHDAGPIDRTIEGAGRVNAGAAQGGGEWQGFPVPARNALEKPPPAQSPAPDRSHGGREPVEGSPMSRR